MRLFSNPVLTDVAGLLDEPPILHVFQHGAIPRKERGFATCRGDEWFDSAVLSDRVGMKPRTWNGMATDRRHSEGAECPVSPQTISQPLR